MDWIGITCWAVLGVSGLLTLWALFWDRPRGRLRCRKCAYDMSGGGLTCPECGREHESERSLRVTRRRWKTALIAVAVVFLALHTQHQSDLIHYEGMSGLLPPLALAVLADPSVIENGIGRYWTGTEYKLHTRMRMSRSSRIADLVWMRKIAKYMQSTTEYTGHVAVTYNILDIIKNHDIFSTDRSYKQAVRDGRATVIGETRRLDSESIVAMILARLLISEYAVAGDNEVECYVDSGIVVLRADRRVHEHFANSLNEIRSRSWTVSRSDLPAVSATACYVLYRIDIDDTSFSTSWNTIVEMYLHINHWLLPRAFDPAYEPSRVALVANGLIVWADPEDHIEIIEYLQSLSSVQ